MAGELGHLTIDDNGPLCRCGGRGCLEAYCSVATVRSLLADQLPGAELPAIVDAARRGNPAALRAIEDAGRRLGVGLAHLANLINPTRIVIGGDLAQAGDILLDAAGASLRRRTLTGIGLVGIAPGLSARRPLLDDRRAAHGDGSQRTRPGRARLSRGQQRLDEHDALCRQRRRRIGNRHESVAVHGRAIDAHRTAGRSRVRQSGDTATPSPIHTWPFFIPRTSRPRSPPEDTVATFFRRSFLKTASTAGAGIALTGSVASLVTSQSAALAAGPGPDGYGPLLPDPAGLLDLPQWFRCRVL